MKAQHLLGQIYKKESFLCVGLDPDINKIPSSYARDAGGMLQFCKDVIDATQDYAVAYKPNVGFFEAYGAEGWKALEAISNYIPEDCFTIADAKRGDIGNTAVQYAKAFFEDLNFDAITVSPYLGMDSIEPFLAYENKVTIVLAITSNKSGSDIQLTKKDDEYLFEYITRSCLEKAKNDHQLMFVAGATKPELLGVLRKVAPNSFFLVPGVGAQGGTIEDVVSAGMNSTCGLLINSTRGIIYKGNMDAVKNAAKELQQKMKFHLNVSKI